MTTTNEIPPLDVRIVAGTENLGTDKRPKEYRASHRTIVLTAANPAQNIAGYDPARYCIHINVMDNPVVLSNSTSAANDASNISGTLTTPNGRILGVSNGSEYPLETQDELWVSAAAFPTRVGITLIREI